MGFAGKGNGCGATITGGWGIVLQLQTIEAIVNSCVLKEVAFRVKFQSEDSLVYWKTKTS